MKFIFCALATFSVLACNPKSPVQVTPNRDRIVQKTTDGKDAVKSFPIQNLDGLRLSSLTLFIWKDNVKDGDLARAMREVRTYDRIEGLAMEYALTMEQLENSNDDKEKSFLKERIDAIISEFGSEEEMYKSFEGLTDIIAYLQSVSDWFELDGSASVVFKTKSRLDLDGMLYTELMASISGVKIGVSQVKDFSPDLGNMSSVKYTEFGSRIEFVLKPSPHELYRFDLHRVSYEDRAQRIIYKGDIIFEQLNESGQVVYERRGQAKMVDRAN